MSAVPFSFAVIGLLVASSALAHPHAGHARGGAPSAVITAPRPAPAASHKPAERHVEWRAFEGSTRLAVPLAARSGDVLVIGTERVVLVDRFDNHAWLRHSDGRRERVTVLWTL